MTTAYQVPANAKHHTNVTVSLHIKSGAERGCFTSPYREPTVKKVYSSKDHPTAEDMKAQIKKDLGELLKRHQAEKGDSSLTANYQVADVNPTPKKFYPTGGVAWVQEAYKFIELRNGAAPEGSTLVLDAPVVWINGYGLRFESNVFGFDTEGKVALYGDCYWMTRHPESLRPLTPTDENSATATLARGYEGNRLHECWTITEVLPCDDIYVLHEHFSTEAEAKAYIDANFSAEEIENMRLKVKENGKQYAT